MSSVWLWAAAVSCALATSGASPDSARCSLTRQSTDVRTTATLAAVGAVVAFAQVVCADAVWASASVLTVAVRRAIRREANGMTRHRTQRRGGSKTALPRTGDVTAVHTHLPSVSPPIAPAFDVFARRVAEVGRPDDEDLQAFGTGLVA